METSESGFEITPLSAESIERLAQELNEEEYRILLNHGTEPAFCGTLLDNKLDGMGGRTKIVNVIDPRMVADYLSTDAGEEIVMNIIGRNQAAVAAYARG